MYEFKGQISGLIYCVFKYFHNLALFMHGSRGGFRSGTATPRLEKFTFLKIAQQFKKKFLEPSPPKNISGSAITD